MDLVTSDGCRRSDVDLTRPRVDSFDGRYLDDAVVQYQVDDLHHRQNASAQQQPEHPAEITCIQGNGAYFAPGTPPRTLSALNGHRSGQDESVPRSRGLSL